MRLRFLRKKQKIHRNPADKSIFKKNIKRRGRNFHILFITKTFLFNKYLYRTLGIVTLVLLILLAIFTYNSYKVTRFSINSLVYSDKDAVSAQIKDYLSHTPFFKIQSDQLAQDIVKNNGLIKEAYVNKSILAGLDINILERSPIAIIQIGADAKYFYTDDSELITYFPTQADLPLINFIGSIDDFKNNPEIQRYITRALIFITQLNKMGIVGTNTCDNFGNLGILTGDNKKVDADVRQRFSPIDEQIKVFQNVLSKNKDFKEIDLRFNYLAVS